MNTVTIRIKVACAIPQRGCLFSKVRLVLDRTCSISGEETMARHVVSLFVGVRCSYLRNNQVQYQYRFGCNYCEFRTQCHQKLAVRQ